MDVSSLTGTSPRYPWLYQRWSDRFVRPELKDDLLGTETNKPTVLDKDGYSLNNYGDDSYIWIENLGGPDYRSKISNTCWTTSDPKKIACHVHQRRWQRPCNEWGGSNPATAGRSPRLCPGYRDTRSLEQRSVTFRISNTATDSRNVIRDYGLQLDTGNAVIDSEIDPGETIVVARPPGVGNTLAAPTVRTGLNRRATPPQRWTSVACTP